MLSCCACCAGADWPDPEGRRVHRHGAPRGPTSDFWTAGSQGILVVQVLDDFLRQRAKTNGATLINGLFMGMTIPQSKARLSGLQMGLRPIKLRLR